MRLSMRLSGVYDNHKADFTAAAAACFDSPSDYARISCDTGVWGDYYDRTFNDWSNTFTNCPVPNRPRPATATGTAIRSTTPPTPRPASSRPTAETSPTPA